MPKVKMSEANVAAPRSNAVISSDPKEVRQVQDGIEKLLRARHAAEPDIFSIQLAVQEAVANAIKHGNRMDHGKKVHIDYSLHADRFEINVTDEGPGFDPADVPDPTDVEYLERPSGRGLLLMRFYMTEVRFNAQGNGVCMSKVLRNGHR